MPRPSTIDCLWFPGVLARIFTLTGLCSGCFDSVASRCRYLHGLHLDAADLAKLVRSALVVSSGSREMVSSGLRCGAVPS